MKIFLGYIIKVICFFLYLILFLSAINNFFYEKHEETDPAYLSGYYIGTFLVVILLAWIIYKFFRFGGKLTKSSKNKNEISEIGVE
jgi:hypothetical protein